MKESQWSFYRTIQLWYNRCTFAIVNPLFDIAKKRAVTMEDVNLNLYPDGSFIQYDMKSVSRQMEDNYWKSGGSLMKAFGTISLQYYAMIVVRLMINVMQIATPVMLSRLVRVYEENDNPDLWTSLWYCGLCLVLKLATSSLNSLFWVKMLAITKSIESGINSTIYNKVLRLSSKSRGEKSAGEILNLLSDSDRIVQTLYDFQNVWSSVFNITSLMYLLYGYIGKAVFAGVVMVFLLSVPNYYMVKRSVTISDQLTDMRDARSKVVTDMLSSIRVIKMFVWERLYSDKLSQLKKKEDEVNYSAEVISGVQGFMWSCVPFLSGASCLIWYAVISGQQLSNSLIFAVLEMVNSLNVDFQCLPSSIHTIVESRLVIKRLRSFLDMEEIEIVPRIPMDSVDIKFSNASFGWTSDKKFLNDIDLEIKKGQFVAIVGGVGSGKSSMLSAILGEIQRLDGSISVNQNRKVAYVEQSPFIRSLSLKNNILFGSKFDKTRYQQVLSVTTLDEDLPQLVNGDNTMIGEKGVNLSGGQKLRCSLARGLYSNSDIYLLDDPLAAVDYKVGEHIFDHAICGYLSGKTRVLVTNQVQYLKKADAIIVMKNGSIQEKGTYEELVNKSDSEFKTLMDLTTTNITHRSSATQEQREDDDAVPDVESEPDEEGSDESDDDTDVYKEDANTFKKISILVQYVTSFSWIWFIAFVAISMAKTGFMLLSDYFVASWSSDSALVNHSTLFYCGFYLIFGLSHLLCSLLNSLLGVHISLKAAEQLHSKLLNRILSATTTFFDVTPCGRLMRAFGKDVLTLDSEIPWKISSLFNSIGVTGLSLGAVLLYAGPSFLIYASPLLYIVWVLQNKYRSAAVDNIQSEISSNCYSYFSETLNGCVTIRAYSEQEQFKRENIQNIQNDADINIVSQVTSAWFSIRMGCIRSLMLCVGCIMISQSSTTAVTAVLVIRNLLCFTDEIQWLLEVLSYLDPNARCLQRMKRLSEQSPVEHYQREVVSQSTETRGHIVFENVTMNYVNDTEPALNGISLEIKPGEKIGVAGRTGSGKSSLFAVLLRLYELSSGRIRIDGQDISKMSLEQLRRMVAIIPQDPILLSGSTLRQNLDPYNEHSDEAIWQALEKVCMKERVTLADDKLSLLIAENGRNFSQGERQLLCMARTLLLMMKSQNPIRVLLMDEVSASVDLKTDSIIKQTVKKYFVECTVLSIAHRLDHLIKFSDRMLVLAAGRVGAFDDVDKILHSSSEQTEQIPLLE